MTMSRKDYEAAAKIVKAMRDATPTTTPAQAHRHVARVQGAEDAFAQFFYADNPRFDAARFRAACGSPLERETPREVTYLRRVD